MGRSDLREILHKYIDATDDRRIEALYTFLENEIHSNYVYDEETLKELDRRRADYMSGAGESYAAEESIEMLRKHLIEKPENSYIYDEETVKELDLRRTNHYNGTSSSYTKEEVIEMVKKRHKQNGV